MPYRRSGKCIWMKGKHGKWFRLKCYKAISTAKRALAQFKRKYR